MREITSSVDEALQADNVPMLVLVQLDFVEGTVRLCNAGYNFEYGGYTWVGVGHMGGISAVTEGEEIEMRGCTLELSGLPPEAVALALGSGYQRRPATIWLAPLDSDYQLLNDPVIIFKGRMDTMPMQVGEQGTIQMTIESALVDWERPRERRFNHADQISEYPDDLGFEYVAQMVEKELIWGRSS